MQIEKKTLFKPFNDECKCIYIHIPKVAGISVEKALFNDKVGHKWALMYKGEDKEKFNEYFKFSFVRNPFDRIVSAFLFLKNGGRNEFDKKWADENLAGISSFEHFVVELKNNEFRDKVLKWTHFIPQYKFVCDQYGEIIVDFIGKFENLQNDFNIVCKRLDNDASLTHENKTQNRKNYQSLYNLKLQNIVYEIYQKDFELFDYENIIEKYS